VGMCVRIDGSGGWGGWVGSVGSMIVSGNLWGSQWQGPRERGPTGNRVHETGAPSPRVANKYPSNCHFRYLRWYYERKKRSLYRPHAAGPGILGKHRHIAIGRNLFKIMKFMDRKAKPLHFVDSKQGEGGSENCRVGVRLGTYFVDRNTTNLRSGYHNIHAPHYLELATPATSGEGQRCLIVMPLLFFLSNSASEAVGQWGGRTFAPAAAVRGV